MQIFKKGDQVKEKDKLQVMTVVGAAGIAAVSTIPGHAVTSARKVTCSWVNNKGKTIQRSFFEVSLELVQ